MSPTPTWHALKIDDVAAKLAVTLNGLAMPEVESRRRQYGANRLPVTRPAPIWRVALRQFASPVIYVLLVAAGGSLAVGLPADAIFIGLVLGLNAFIGTVQEWRAEMQTHALRHLLKARATVIRDGEQVEIDAESIVVGDVVLLESGFRVPADLRLITAYGLQVDESLLTGESIAVAKNADAVVAADTPLAERINMVYAGATVARGRAKALAVATGTQTVVGRLARDVMAQSAGKPPLIERMQRFANFIAWVTLVVVTAVGIFGVLVRNYGVADMFVFAVALAVSAIPEGLPVALTVVLAVAVHRMAKRGVIVRRLAAVEGLGSCTLIASDKTGTLTCNELTVREVYLPDGRIAIVDGQGFAPLGDVVFASRSDLASRDLRLLQLAETAMLCNEADLHKRGEAWVWHGDPTDVAFLALGGKLGIDRQALLDRFPQISELGFTPERQFAATFHRDADTVRICVKGAPERILGMCKLAADLAEAQRIHAAQMAERGFRVLGVAAGDVAELAAADVPAEPANLDFLGFVGMIDPLRPGAREAVKDCLKAGIQVCMITGDHPVTALAIARELGFAEHPSQVINGKALEGLNETELAEIVARTRVFARATPTQKLDIVRAARNAGHYVAVTGDGVNDAPALRQANIGVAMGRSGTDVARDAADLVITDDNFATIVAGVEEGRVAYDNIRKVIALLIATGLAELLLLGFTVISGIPAGVAGLAILPLLPAQLLWLNLVTNGIQHVGLAFEPPEFDVLIRRPRPPKEPIFNRLMIERSFVAAITMASVGFAAFYWLIEYKGASDVEARNFLLLLMVMFENVHVGNCRSETRSALGLSPLKSPILLAGVFVAFGIHVAAMHMPVMQKVLGVQPVGLETYGLAAILSLSVLLTSEIHKIVWRRKAV